MPTFPLSFSGIPVLESGFEAGASRWRSMRGMSVKAPQCGDVALRLEGSGIASEVNFSARRVWTWLPLFRGFFFLSSFFLGVFFF